MRRTITALPTDIFLDGVWHTSLPRLASRKEFERPNPMFKCEITGRVVPPGTPMKRVVVKIRKKKYSTRKEVHRHVKVTRNGKKVVVWKDDIGGTGFEIVKELIACPEAAALAPEPEIVE